MQLEANYGKIGPTTSEAKMTFGVGALVRVPILEGGHIRGKLLEADAELRQQKARLEDLRDAIYYEIQNALLDVQAAEQDAWLAHEAVGVAEEHLARFTDRGSATEPPAVSTTARSASPASATPPASSSDEKLQAEDAAAVTNDRYISALYTYTVAKLALARALGVAAEAYTAFLGGAGR